MLTSAHPRRSRHTFGLEFGNLQKLCGKFLYGTVETLVRLASDVTREYYTGGTGVIIRCRSAVPVQTLLIKQT